MVYEPKDLEPLEIALLGVLCVGLPPERSADATFRVDHVTAVVAGLQAEERTKYLGSDGITVKPEFRQRLRSAVKSLEEKEILTSQASGMPAAPGGYEPEFQLNVVNPDEHPILTDTFLGQACMEELMKDRAVYEYLIERYAKSGEVWRRLREAGYGN